MLEHVPVAYRASLNANVFRVVGQSLKNLGIFPLESDILQSGEMVAQIEDKITRRIAYTFQRVKAQSKTFDLSARALVTENISFVCVRVKDESEV